MPKCLAKKVAEKADYEERLHQSLANGSKMDLIATLMELSYDNRPLFHQLGARFQLEALPEYIAIAAYTGQSLPPRTSTNKRSIAIPATTTRPMTR
jgi:hypothetical protein